MEKRVIPLILLIALCILFTGCGNLSIEDEYFITDCFDGDVRYTEFVLDETSLDGFSESEEAVQSLAQYIDGVEDNIPMLSYRSIIFTTQREGKVLTHLFFKIQAEADCTINIEFYYGGELIDTCSLELKKDALEFVMGYGMQVNLMHLKEFKIVFVNPLEIGAVRFRTDSYVFAGVEVD